MSQPTKEQENTLNRLLKGLQNCNTVERYSAEGRDEAEYFTPGNEDEDEILISFADGTTIDKEELSQAEILEEGGFKIGEETFNFLKVEKMPVPQLS